MVLYVISISFDTGDSAAAIRICLPQSSHNSIGDEPDATL